MAHLYYCDPAAPLTSPGASIHVAGEEGHHAVRVARLRAGESILLGDGYGQLAECEVTAVAKDSFTATVTAPRDPHPAPTPRLVLVQALAKGDRDLRAVEQATELGVDAVIPWQATRCVSNWRGKEGKGQEKWQRIAREAAKQSLRARIPEVRQIAGTNELLERAAAAGAVVCVLHPWEAMRLSDWLRDALAEWRGTAVTPAELWFVIGPEGGVTDAELTQFRQAGASSVVLGDTVLRTSTAGPAALITAQLLLGRW